MFDLSLRINGSGINTDSEFDSNRVKVLESKFVQELGQEIKTLVHIHFPQWNVTL